MAVGKQSQPSQAKDNRTRILLVDDHAVVRYGIAQLINRESDLVVCGEEEEAGNALTAIAAQAGSGHRGYFFEGKQRAGADAQYQGAVREASGARG